MEDQLEIKVKGRKQELLWFALSVIICALSIILAYRLMQHKHTIDTLEYEIAHLSELNTEYKTSIESLEQEVHSLNKQIVATKVNAIDDETTYIKTHTNYETLSELCTAVNIAESKNTQYESKIDELTTVCADLLDRVNIYEYYEYALFDTAGKRNDIYYEDIKLLEELTVGEPVNDIDLYLSWIMIESEGHRFCKSPKSTAKGLPQFLDGTSKNVYRQLDFEQEWYPEIVYDKEISLTMMVRYVNDLLNLYKGNLAKAIDSYRGFHDVPYLNYFNKYLAKTGKSIDRIAINVKDRYDIIKEYESGGQG